MIAVLKHELKNYFHSLTAYVFGAFLLAFTGKVPPTPDESSGSLVKI